MLKIEPNQGRNYLLKNIKNKQRKKEGKAARLDQKMQKSEAISVESVIEERGYFS